MALSVTPTECLKILEWNVRAGVTTMIKGSPSTAKSAVAHQLAREFNLFLIDQRVSQVEPEDMQGMPRINPKTGRSEYVPFDWLPLEGDPIPKGYDGWLLFLDELNAGEKAVTKATYKLLLDRMVGQHKLHTRCALVGAGNLDTDGALVEDMGTAAQSRMTYVHMEVDHKGWLTWARKNGIDHRITSFIEFKPALLYTFDPEKASLDHNYACYRTWEFAHKQVQQIGDELLTAPEALVALAGSLSEGVAREFLAHCRLEGKLPPFAQIVKDPTGTPVPEEPGALYALTGSLAQHATETTIKAVVTYLRRMPKEFQVVALRELLARNYDLAAAPAVASWIAEESFELWD